MDQNTYCGDFYDDETKTLNLTQRDLRTLPADIIETYCMCAQHIDLSQNRLSDLSWITEFVQLKEVILDNNRLCEIHLKRLSKPLVNVTVLMLNKNEFGDLKETIEHISRLFPNLEHLGLHGNAICPDGLGLRPFSDYVAYDCAFYRSFILNALPNLKFLDHASTKMTEFSDITSTYIGTCLKSIMSDVTMIPAWQIGIPVSLRMKGCKYFIRKTENDLVNT